MVPLSLSQFAKALDGVVSGGRVRFSPPGHSRADRSAWIEIAPALPDGFYVGTFAADDPLAIKQHVKALLGITRQHPFARAVTHEVSASDEADRTAKAPQIWFEAKAPWGTPVEAYLTRPRPQGRGVELPPEAAGEAIRFHAECPFAHTSTPAMVCLVRDVLTNKPKAIHRTALDRNGNKAVVGGTRLSYGPTRRGAIKLTPDEEVTMCLGIGERVESTLSLRNCDEFGPSAIWSLLSAGGIQKLPVLAGVESLWIAVDNDINARGPLAGRACAERWRTTGREVFLVTPTARGADLNDISPGARHA